MLVDLKAQLTSLSRSRWWIKPLHGRRCTTQQPYGNECMRLAGAQKQAASKAHEVLSAMDFGHYQGIYMADTQYTALLPHRILLPRILIIWKCLVQSMTIGHPFPRQIPIPSRRKIFTDSIWRDFGSINLDGFREGKDFEGPCISITRETLFSVSRSMHALLPDSHL